MHYYKLLVLLLLLHLSVLTHPQEVHPDSISFSMMLRRHGESLKTWKHMADSTEIHRRRFVKQADDDWHRFMVYYFRHSTGVRSDLAGLSIISYDEEDTIMHRENNTRYRINHPFVYQHQLYGVARQKIRLYNRKGTILEFVIVFDQ